jgi:dolichyl-phosphate-mannose--protein O-mannosyl transferase
MPNIIKRYAPWLFLTPGILLGIIVVIAASLMLYSAWHESAIMDELAHIPAGYGYVRYFDYRLNPEHPPLVKALSAVPLLPLNLSFPTATEAWQTAINGQWAAGSEFLYHSGNDADTILHAARLFPILLTLLLIILVYAVAKETLGRYWALLPAFLTAFSPIVLAHGHYVTTDIGATLGILLSLWRGALYFERPSRKNLWLAGLSLGIAELLKFSAVLVPPYLLFLALVHWFRRRREKSILPYAGAMVAIFAIAYLIVVYPVYALFTAHYPMARQTADTVFTLGSFAGGAAVSGCHGTRCLADLNIALTKNAFTPSHGRIYARRPYGHAARRRRKHGVLPGACFECRVALVLPGGVPP